MFWNCGVVVLLVCVLQSVAYFWLNSLYDFKAVSTLSPQFSSCFDFGVGFTALGVTLMLHQECGLTLGTLCSLASIMFLLETLKPVEKGSGSTESEPGSLLFPALGGLLFLGKALRSLEGRALEQDEFDGVHIKSKLTEAWAFMRTQVERLITKSTQGQFKVTAPLLAIFACFVLTFTVASKENFRLAFIFSVLQIASLIWLASLFDFKWETAKLPSFERCFLTGVGCKLAGTFTLLCPFIGFNLFSLLYSVGTVSSLASIYFLTEKGRTVTLEDAVSRLIEWIKKKVGVLDSDSSKWVTYLDFYHSDIGGIAEGLCALLFPALAVLFGAAHVAAALRGQKKTTPVNAPVQDAKKHQRNERDKELDELQRMVMKVLRFVTLGAVVLWFWGFALLVWTSSCLLLGVFFSLHQKSTNIGFIVCFLIGAFFTFLGVYLMDQPEFGLTLFSIFYTVGNVCVLGSTLFVVEVSQQLNMAFERKRAASSSVMIFLLVLTLFAALWWKSFIVALTFCILHITSSIWYCLTYVQYSRRVFTSHELTKDD